MASDTLQFIDGVPDFETRNISIAMATKTNIDNFIAECIIDCPGSTLSLDDLYTRFKAWHQSTCQEKRIYKYELKEELISRWSHPMTGYVWLNISLGNDLGNFVESWGSIK
jgi:hypothetical protein